MSAQNRLISLAVVGAVALAVWATTKPATRPGDGGDAGPVPAAAVSTPPSPHPVHTKAVAAPTAAISAAAAISHGSASAGIIPASGSSMVAAEAPSPPPSVQAGMPSSERPPVPGGVDAARRATLDAGTVALWEDWRRRFLTVDGRVLDTGNGGISHSEGQGYGMLLAARIGDRASFARIWSWTYTTLFVRDDGMMAWRYDPKATPPITDRNSASDGDILVAWALAEAGRRWSDADYTDAAASLAAAIRETVIVEHGGRLMVLPGQEGFRRDAGLVVNPAYWVLPAFPVLATVDADGAAVWTRLAGETPAVMAAVRFGDPSLPPEWVVADADGGFALPQDPDFAATFGYNAVRVPLYLAWAGVTDPALPIYAELDRLWPAGAVRGIDRPQVVALPEGVVRERGRDAGFRAVAGLVACIVHDARLPDDVTAVDDTASYYAASLMLMVRMAAAERKPACL
ncbi:glycosyl hydrolase family 8 [Tistrella bauzanensis]|uniref:glycosyl hydrolase family 8 n=1 Tax=Tistrella TaxID=171436 RepID=UPI0031F6368E